MKHAWVVAGLAVVLASQAARADDVPLWDQASKTYESAMSQYKQNLHGQAQGLFEEFIRKFPSHEMVPYAHLQLAHCRASLKNRKGWEDAIDEVIRRFPNSPTWFVAYSSKLGAAAGKKDGDEYLDLLETMSRVCKEVPLDFLGCWMQEPSHTWYNSGRSNRWVGFDHLPWAPATIAPGGERQLLRMCDTPDRAQRALKILTPTFKKKRSSYVEWQFVHVMLLRAAGKDDEAGKTLDAYVDDWGNDPSAIQLWLQLADAAAADRDDKAFDRAWEAITKKYAGNYSLSEFIGRRLAYLSQRGRWADWDAVADAYLKDFPKGSQSWGIFGARLARLRPAVLKGDATALADSQALIEKHTGKDSAFGRQWNSDLLVEMGKHEEAAKLLEVSLLDDSRWCANTYQAIQNWTARGKMYAPILEAAKTKYKIPAADPNGPAGELLKVLKGRIKEEQVRFMEEIGNEFLQKHPASAEAVTALKLLVDYYYAKVQPEPRDRWANEMINRFGRHPLVEDVMLTQVKALTTGRKYDELGAMLDQLRERFPGNDYGFDWCDSRLAAYGAMKDAEGRDKIIRMKYEESAGRGDLRSIQIVGSHELGAMKADNKQSGDYWMEKAKKFEGHWPQRLMWTWALRAYRQGPNEKEPNQVVCWDDCNEVVRLIQEQTADPEMRWAYAMTDITLMFEKREAGAALEALYKRITKDTHARQLGGLEWGVVVHTLIQTKMFKEGLALADKMEKVDGYREGSFNWLRAALYEKSGQNALAAQLYQQMVDDNPWPASACDRVMQLLAVAGPNAAMFVDRYIASIPKAQDVILKVLQEEGKNAAMRPTVRARLAKDYPASAVRGFIENLIAQEHKKKS